MQNTSTAFEVGIISTKRTLAVKAVLQTADATIYNLGPGDIVAGSLSVDSACFQDGIELGSTMAADCSISLNNADGRWNNIGLDGATLWPYSGLVLPDTTTEHVKLGTFIIDEPGRPYSQLTLQASDRMILLDEPFSAVVRTFPATNAQVLTAISVHCNVPLATSISGILNASYSVTTRPTEDITCRDIVGMIALMAAGFARMTRDGELEIVQLPDLSGTIDLEMPVGSRYEGFKQTSDPVTVTGLTYADTDETVQIGTDAYSLQVEHIPILQDNRDTILQSIFAVISGYTYTGFTCPYPGNPAIDVGDSVRHVTMDGKTIVSLVASHNFVHGGKSTMEATAKSQSSMSYKGANARRLSTIAAKVQGVDNKLTTYQQTQAQFTDLLTQAMGYFVTEEPQLDGSIIHYEHDHPLLADSIVIYKKTATTMSWTPDAGAHWYGMTDEGDIIARKIAATDISAERITISGASTYASGYDPSTKETPAGAQAKADAAYVLAQSFTNSIVSELQSQIDGSVSTFFYAYVPTLENVPSSDWATTALKNQHLGDLFYDTSTGYSYRYQLVSTTYSWQRISDTDITTALANAATAQDTADHKRRVFVATPTTPYDIGDLWAGGSTGDLKRCSTARASGAYVAGDWILASKYTDDTTANNIQVGGRNLVLNSKIPITTTAYMVKNYVMSEPMEVGVNYTVSVKGNFGAGVTILVYCNSGSIELARIPATAGDQTYTITFVGKTGNNIIEFYNSPAVETLTTIDWAKLEKGNKATDWTPAPEDVDALITTAQSAADNAATVADAKNKVFYTQPVPPYYIGDIWQKQQVPVAVTDIVKCTVTRLTGVYTAADWANAYTLAEIAEMGDSILVGGYFKTALIDVVTLIAQMVLTNSLVSATLTNDATDPVCWATIGTVEELAANGLFVYHRGNSVTVPAFQLVTNSSGDIILTDKYGRTRMLFYAGAGGSGSSYFCDGLGFPRLGITAGGGIHLWSDFVGGVGDTLHLGAVTLPAGDVQEQINNISAPNTDTLLPLASIITITTIYGATIHAAGGGIYYYKIGPRVHVHVAVSGLTANTAVDLIALPASYRPYSTVVALCSAGVDAPTVARLVIVSNGTINVVSSGTYLLGDIEYDAYS